MHRPASWLPDLLLPALLATSPQNCCRHRFVPCVPSAQAMRLATSMHGEIRNEGAGERAAETRDEVVAYTGCAHATTGAIAPHGDVAVV